MTSKTVYVSIGNSDDKLTQAEWQRFCERFAQDMRLHTGRIYGVWFSRPDSEYQNMCIAGEVYEHLEPMLRERLAILAARFGQDSIAWAEATTTFLAPEPKREPPPYEETWRCSNCGDTFTTTKRIEFVSRCHCGSPSAGWHKVSAKQLAQEADAEALRGGSPKRHTTSMGRSRTQEGAEVMLGRIVQVRWKVWRKGRSTPSTSATR